MYQAQFGWLRFVVHGGRSPFNNSINGAFHHVLYGIEYVLLLIPGAVRFPPLLSNGSMVHIHQCDGFLPKESMRYVVLKAGSPPAWRIAIPGLVNTVLFFNPVLQFSLCAFF